MKIMPRAYGIHIIVCFTLSASPTYKNSALRVTALLVVFFFIARLPPTVVVAPTEVGYLGSQAARSLEGSSHPSPAHAFDANRALGPAPPAEARQLSSKFAYSRCRALRDGTRRQLTCAFRRDFSTPEPTTTGTLESPVEQLLLVQWQ